ncbi:MAG TPA: ABC transporter substrate-binding protein [Alphaproteobacteria bacterium]|jgi:phospholipid transport system substrate-binding protein|nr:ABC transporter substrate-binding protein [Alphaproteobacteria bacterium]
MALRRPILAFAAFMASGLMAFTAHAEPSKAQLVVEKSYAVLLDVMKESKTLGYSGRFQRIAPFVETVFNLPLMAQTTAGAYWIKATEEERKRFVEAFGRMTAATLAVRFNGYSGEKFDVLGTEQKSPDTALVKTQIVQGDGDKVEVDYLLRSTGGEWKVADVYANGGISELAVKTADYAQVLKTGGVEALATALDKKAEILAQNEK